MLSVSRPEISWSPPGETCWTWWSWWSPPSRGSCWTSAEDWASGTCCVSPEPSSSDFIYLQSYNNNIQELTTILRLTNYHIMSMRSVVRSGHFWPLFGTTRGEVRTSARPCHGNPLPPSVADRQFCSVNFRLSSRWVFLHHPGP